MYTHFQILAATVLVNLHSKMNIDHKTISTTITLTICGKGEAVESRESSFFGTGYTMEYRSHDEIFGTIGSMGLMSVQERNILVVYTKFISKLSSLCIVESRMSISDVHRK